MRIQHNAAKGYHFFDRGTMKFWKSRVESTLIRGRYFITSEDEWAMDGKVPKRIYAVRYANNDATIKTMASFLKSKDEARECDPCIYGQPDIKRAIEQIDQAMAQKLDYDL